MHQDGEIIGFPHQHYHVDPRFIPPRTWGWMKAAAAAQPPDRKLMPHVTTPITVVLPDDGTDINYARLPNVPGPRELWIRKTPAICYRDETDYPAYDEERIPWLDELAEAFREQRLGPDGACPHRGGQVATVKPDEEGCATCPMHGLRWNLTTGELAMPTTSTTAGTRGSNQSGR